MRYLVTARVRPGADEALARAIDDGTLGQGSIAGDEYFRNMAAARQMDDGRAVGRSLRDTLAEEREAEPVFHPRQVRTRMRAAAPRSDRHGAVACGDCDNSARLERLETGRPFRPPERWFFRP
jgi:hypothetical protein